jgi:two-component system, OmpR family, response regulator CpxR
VPRLDVGTVLLADDDDDLRETIASALARRGYSVLVARHGHEALTLAQQAEPPPQLILLDLMMRMSDGKDFLAERQLDPRIAGIPVVIMSGLSTEVAVARWTGGARVAGWLTKPVALSKLLATVASFCVAPEPTGG